VELVDSLLAELHMELSDKDVPLGTVVSGVGIDTYLTTPHKYE